VTRAASGEPPIHFYAHQSRGGETGAREDFEQMIALLVTAVRGDARLVYANPGDWGIDALVGELHGRVTIWQAKYFIGGVKGRHREQIEKSFNSAWRNADEKGYEVEEWVLCVPSSLDPALTRWWDVWRGEQERATGVRLTLWDETALRNELYKPAAAHIRRAFYHPYREAPTDESDWLSSARPELVVPESPVRTDVRTPWRGGDQRRLGGVDYLLHEPTVNQIAPDQSWVWREATADRLTDLHRIRLRQVQLLRRAAAGEQLRDELRGQGRLWHRIGGRAGLPRLLETVDETGGTTLVSVLPAGPTWRQRLGPAAAGAPIGRFNAAVTLGAAVEIATALTALHDAGQSHRALSPDGVVLANKPRRAVLVDAGLAGMTARPGEGPPGHQAPEQHRSTTVGRPADLYQLAALLYWTLTGHPPSTYGSPPIRLTLPELPEELDNLLADCLDPDADNRPSDLRALVTALRSGHRQLSTDGAR
jgi:hypothetical protein